MGEDKDVVVKVEHVSKKFSKSLKRAMLYGRNLIVSRLPITANF